MYKLVHSGSCAPAAPRCGALATISSQALMRQPPQGLDGWLAHLEALHPRGSAGIELGLERVAAVKSRLGQRETCPVILVGGLRSLAVMEAVIEEGIADMVALCRPFVKESDLVKRFSNGQAKVACVSCNACFNPKGIRCNYKDNK